MLFRSKTKIKATAILTRIPKEKMLGGTPINNTENTHPRTNMKNPLVKTTIALYFAAYSMYGPSITSDLALIIENGYSFKIIIYPMKNTIAAIAPDTVNKNGPWTCWNATISFKKILPAAATGANNAKYNGKDP